MFVAFWSRGLLMPNPIDPGNDEVLGYKLFLFSKTLHVTAYAVFAVLSGWLQVPWRLRWLLIAFMSAHAIGTEYFQNFVPTRHASWRDVGLDLLGMTLGILISWKWWWIAFTGSQPRQTEFEPASV